MNTPEILKSIIDRLYPRLMSEQEVWLGEHWNDFNSQKAKLEGMVGREFEKVVGELSPIPDFILSRHSNAKNPEILGYKAVYDPQSREFRIKLTRLKLPNENIMDDAEVLSSQYGCSHVFLDMICGFEDEVHPRIKRFKEEYSVRDINYPNNNCHHK